MKLRGNRTYLALLAAGVVLACYRAGWISEEDFRLLIGAAAAAAIAFLRAAFDGTK